MGVATDNSLETQLTTLLPRIALAPLVAVAAVAIAVPSARGVLWYLAAIAPIAAVLAAWFGRRVGRAAMRRRAATESREPAPRPPRPAADKSAAAATRARRLVRARRQAGRALRASQLVRAVTAASLRTHADALALLMALETDSAKRPEPGPPHGPIGGRGGGRGDGPIGKRGDGRGGGRSGGRGGDPALQIARMAADAARAYRHVRHLVSDIRCPRAPVAERPVNVARAVALALELLQPRLARLGVSTAVTCDPELPACVGDIRSLQSIFVQLIDSAAAFAKSAAPGLARIAISAYPSAPPAVDTGGGRPASTGSLAVFVDIVGPGPERLDDDPAPRFAPGPTGLTAGREASLAVCHHVLTRIGGVLELSPGDDGRGTRAWVAIPVADPSPWPVEGRLGQMG